jgi:hypothetical protein
MQGMFCQDRLIFKENWPKTQSSVEFTGNSSHFKRNRSKINQGNEQIASAQKETPRICDEN